MDFELPRTLTLPSGARLTVTATRPPPPREASPRTAKSAGPRFSDVLELFARGDVRLDAGDVLELALADFHVLRAVLTKAGWVEEDEVELDCHNCGALLTLYPCARLETGPWEDDELGDPELDRTPPFGKPIPIEPVPLGRVRRAHTVTLAPRTVREAAPLFAAVGKDPFDVDEAVVDAMGITALGPTTDRAAIARALAECGDTAFDSVTDAFLATHYPLRLAADVFCTSCKARNTVDAPAAREFELGRGSSSGGDPEGRTGVAAETDGIPRMPLPPLEEFVELAHVIAEPLIAELPGVGEPVEFVVDDGTPAVDDGGEPLLGSYMPPPPKDAPTATRPPTVTVYYRTFEAIAREDGPTVFDWEAELRETIEHELEHHLYFLRGDDPMDEEEHAEIDREALRVVGRAEATRRTFAVFGESVPDFFTRAWPLVLIAAAVLAITLAEGRCAPD